MAETTPVAASASSETTSETTSETLPSQLAEVTLRDSDAPPTDPASATTKKNKRKKKKKKSQNIANTEATRSSSEASSLPNASAPTSSDTPGSLLSSSRVLSIEDAWKAIEGVLKSWRSSSTNPAELLKLFNTDQLLSLFVKENPRKLELLFAADSPTLQTLLTTKISNPEASHQSTAASPAGQATSRTESSLLDVLFTESAPWIKLDPEILKKENVVLIMERGPLAELLATLDPTTMFRSIVNLCHSLRFTNRQYGAKLAGFYLERSGKKSAKDHGIRLPGEALDSLNALAFKTPMPDILPPDELLLKMTPDQIVASLSKYCGETGDQLLARLRPSAESQLGFIGAQENLGELILEDIKQLKALGVTRHELAERMQLVAKIGGYPFFDSWLEHLARQPPSPQREQRVIQVMDLRRQAKEELERLLPRGIGSHPWKVVMHQYVGYQADPFHPTFDNPLNERGRDYYVAHIRLALKAKVGKLSEEVDSQNRPRWPSSVSLFFSSLAPILIRRAAFFEGREVKHRIDPIKACRILGLHPDMRWDPKKD